MTFLLLLGFLSLFAAGMADNIRGPLLPDIIRTLQITDTQASLLFSVAAATGIAGGFFSGPLLRRFGTLFCLRLFTAAYVGGYWLIAAAPTFAVVLIGSSLYGIGVGVLHVVHNVLVSQEASPQRQTRHFNILHMMYGLAALSSPLAAVKAGRFFGGWQMVFVLMTALPILLIAASSLARPKKPAAAVLTERLPFLKVVTLEPCRFYAFFLGFYVASELGVSIWLVLYISRLGIYSAMESAGFLSGYFAAMTFSRLLCALFLKGPWRLPLLIAASGAGIGAILLGIHHHPAWFCLLGFIVGPIFPTAMACLSAEIPHEAEAAIGWVLTAVFVGISLSQTAMGALSEHFTIGKAIYFPAALLFVALSNLILRYFLNARAFSKRKARLPAGPIP